MATPKRKTTRRAKAKTAKRGSGRDPRAYTSQYLLEKIPRSRSALEGERKQVTVLFVIEVVVPRLARLAQSRFPLQCVAQQSVQALPLRRGLAP